MQRFAVWIERLKGNLNLVRDYASLLGGSAGRLVLSLAYFVSIANGLSVGDFGLFATASATGIVLSRIAGFGFVSPLYRVATVRRRLVGTYTAGLIVAFIMSLPLVAIAAAGFYVTFFKGEMSIGAFAAVVLAEVVFWRALEVVVIVNNGLGRFMRGAIIVIAGSAIRAVAAVGFVMISDGSLVHWALAYAGANAVAAGFAVIAYYPRQRLRLRPALYLARWRDSVSVASAEIIFYLQSELDKLLVLSLGGPQMAGIYAILMRLIDLTALPIRSFNTMIVQKLMRTPEWLTQWRIRWGIEAAVAAVSVAGLGFLGGVLHVFPMALGKNVAEAAPLVLLALFVPAFRNLVEYESELLYARGRTGIRAMILAVVGLIKAALLIVLLRAAPQTETWIFGLNGLFLVLWIVSAAATYAAFDWTAPPAARSARRLTPAQQPGE
ncbi:lipopolysaccharide biosynthesis protein [Aurantimonas sp. C2-6-R+9]|uniref:lipopolysaccharide biosynthesis protein n=1 Tax=unclassified Aurantimonas TaxID=2638230 RepID=UPI002E18F240|nr:MULTISPECIES: lipopolysaccharide biosynthesis protein [unclassified Aurantimonas]MEC5291788.1 lipopolysaccharide biosynthesis protein [Aurantimonas sp. C2-3-R2]MEC5381947.1 lipopolysaccharide biosynthesis protein [Aurantimonas sp. C2-6-R+9]MEC5412873.1 lipopolysaccharide biosynthesis protein [Aurantimonas sp. C2-4-R8]